MKITIKYVSFMMAAMACVPNMAHAEDAGAVVSMCAQGQETIQPDMANLTFSLTVKAASKIEAANKANQVQGDASRFVKSRDAQAKIVNQGYQTSETYDKNGKPNGWQVAQNFVVKTKKLDDLDDMTAKLQELGLVFGGVGFSVTNELIDSMQDSLYKKAFANLQKRMDIITSGVRASKWEVVSMDLMSNRACNESALQAANVAVNQYARSYADYYVRLGRGVADADSSEKRFASAEIAAPTFDPADQTLKLNLWIQARIK